MSSLQQSWVQAAQTETVVVTAPTVRLGAKVVQLQAQHGQCISVPIPVQGVPFSSLDQVEPNPVLLGPSPGQVSQPSSSASAAPPNPRGNPGNCKLLLSCYCLPAACKLLLFPLDVSLAVSGVMSECWIAD